MLSDSRDRRIVLATGKDKLMVERRLSLSVIAGDKAALRVSLSEGCWPGVLLFFR